MAASSAAKKSSLSSPTKGAAGGAQKRSTQTVRDGGKQKRDAPSTRKRTSSTAVKTAAKTVVGKTTKPAVGKRPAAVKTAKRGTTRSAAMKNKQKTTASKSQKATTAAGKKKTSSSTEKKKVAAIKGGKQKKSSTKTAASKRRGVRMDAAKAKSVSTPTKARKVTAAVGGSDAALEPKTQQEQTSPMVDPLLASPAPRSVVELLHRQQARQAAQAAPLGSANAEDAMQQKQRIPGAVVESTHDNGRAAGSSNGVAESDAPSSKEAAHRARSAPDAKPTTRKHRKGPRRGRAPPIPANDLVADVLGTMEQWYVAALQAGWWQRPLDVPVVE